MSDEDNVFDEEENEDEDEEGQWPSAFFHRSFHQMFARGEGLILTRGLKMKMKMARKKKRKRETTKIKPSEIRQKRKHQKPHGGLYNFPRRHWPLSERRRRQDETIAALSLTKQLSLMTMKKKTMMSMSWMSEGSQLIARHSTRGSWRPI
jgi:hypothetical protein